VSSKESESEVKLKLQDGGTSLPELPQEYVVPVLDKNGAVVSNDIQSVGKFYMVSCM
jgi:hypothetical protein